MDLELHYNVYGCFRDPRADVDLAKAAVDAGFEGIWIGDHFMPWIDSRPYTHHVFPWFGALMSEVEDVPVGTSVSCPMLRYRPPLFAQAVATLDSMYPGRINVGVGTGEALNEAHFVEEWADWGTRAEMLVESIDLMRELWTSEEHVRFGGEHFDYEHGIKLYTRPKAEIPIHWAAWGPTSATYAGRHADHLITAAGADHIAETLLPNFERGLADAGRSLADDDVAVSTEVGASVGDPDDLVAEIRSKGEYIPTEERDNPDPREIQAVADRRLPELSDEEIREANNITDDPADIIAELEALAEAGVTRALVGSNCGDPYRTIEVFEEEIVPHFAD
jgi:coenzyme F420-dependent glucose-6-phosphate dehydrogenase